MVLRFLLWTSAVVSTVIMLTFSVMYALLQRGDKQKRGIFKFPPTPQSWSTCQEAMSTLNSTFDVIILGSSLSAIVLGAILSVLGKRVLILESGKCLGTTSDNINLSCFGCARYVSLLFARLVSMPDILAVEQLGSKADGFHHLNICLGDSTVSLNADGDTSGRMPPTWWDECRQRCYVGVFSLIILQLLPRWVSEKPKEMEQQPRFFETSDMTTFINVFFGKAKNFGNNVVRRIHAGCVAALRSVAGETTEAYVQRFLNPGNHGALCSSLGGGQSIFTGGILPNESSALLPAMFLCYYEHGAYFFSRGMHAVSLALVETVVAGGGLVCVDTPPCTLLLKASDGSSHAESPTGLNHKRCVSGVRIDDTAGTVLHAGTIVSSLGATTTYLTMQVQEATATTDISSDVSDNNVVANPVNLLTEADLETNVVENAHLRNLTVAARVTIPRSRITVMSEFFHASYNIVSVPADSKRFAETYCGDISQHQMCYYAFPSPCIVNETMMMLLCPRISQAILCNDSTTSSDHDGGGDGDGNGETIDVLVLGELPQEWLDVWSTDNQEANAETIAAAAETPLEGEEHTLSFFLIQQVSLTLTLALLSPYPHLTSTRQR